MTVLANEQVIDGKGWRSGAPVERKKLSQWFLKITDFAEELLEGLGTLDEWPDKVRLMQENWIGKSQGLQFCFRLAASTARRRPATSRSSPPGPTRFSARASSPFRRAIRSPRRWRPSGPRSPSSSPRRAPAEPARRRSRRPRSWASIPGWRSFTRSIANWRLPVWIANFVLMEYGTGALYGVPGHDVRDFEFARKYRPADPAGRCRPAPAGADRSGNRGRTRRRASRSIRDSSMGLTTKQATAEVIRRAETAGWGQGKTQYRLRDWGVSRQRYWGTPIPVIHCDACGPVGVPRDQLPVVLPEDVSFDVPGNPLDRHPSWSKVDCPQCGGAGAARDRHARHVRRFQLVFHPLRQPARRPAVRPRGGREMASGRAIYRRGRACDPAPALRPLLDPRAGADGQAFGQGTVQGPVHPGHGDPRDLSQRATAAGSTPTRSKSAKAVRWSNAQPAPRSGAAASRKCPSRRRIRSIPEPILDRYGADAVRWFMLSDSPPERDLEWSESGIEGAARFVQRVWRLVQSPAGNEGEDKALAAQAPSHHRGGRRGDRRTAVQQIGRCALRADQRDREGAAVGEPRRGDSHPCCCWLRPARRIWRKRPGPPRRRRNDRRRRMAVFRSRDADR